MGAPRATRPQRAHRLATITKRVSVLLDVLALLDSIDDVDAPSKKRYMQHRVQKQLLLSILVLPWCDEAIYLRCMSKKQTYAKKYSVPHRHHVPSSELRFAVVRRCPGA